MKLDRDRLDILGHQGNLLVCGGPGCGKTTIALAKAKQRIGDLRDGQRVLFLSFSRAAVRQIVDRMQGLLTVGEQGRLEIRTFHSFFMDLVRSHGKTLNGITPSFVTPDREALLRSEFEGDWRGETTRMAEEEGVYVFDKLAPAAAGIAEASEMVRALYSDAYPFIIVDEFQDTNIDQWRVVQALSLTSTIMCLADPDQRIFDYLEGVDEHRVQEAIAVLSPKEFDLSKDNHRSGGSGLLDYANAVLRNATMEVPEAVRHLRYQYPNEFPSQVHRVIVALHRHFERSLGKSATVAVLARTNSLLGNLSEKISDERHWGAEILPAVEHELNWDPELSAAAGLLVASILEWPKLGREEALIGSLQAVARYYRVKLDGGTLGARTTVQTMERAILALREGKTVRPKTAKMLIRAYENGFDLSGDPVGDWQVARRQLSGSTELTEMYKQVRLLRLLRATDELAYALAESWDGSSSYPSARKAVESVLAEQAIDGASEDSSATSLMSLHKSKGKEFDGVVIVEGAFNGTLLDPARSQHEDQAARRLLRVGITRARHVVVFVRPMSALPLLDGTGIRKTP
ncbi:ATP-dependent helicase [Pseudonocardia alni]|uniref:ATP-dependent helicase n=1 Tax=Pseudonocardia alni TaxID=33907 RepID=UPI0033C60B11